MVSLGFTVQLLTIMYISSPETAGQQPFLAAVFPPCFLSSPFVIKTLFSCLLLSSSFLQYMTRQIIQVPVAFLHQCAIGERHMAHCRVIKSQGYLHSCHRHANKPNLLFPSCFFIYPHTSPPFATSLCSVLSVQHKYTNK